MTENLQVLVQGRRDEGDAVVVALRGELDISSGPSVERRVTEVIDDLEPFGRVEIDLAELGFCDSSGIYVLIRLREKASATGRQLVLMHPQGMVARLFEVADLAATVEIVAEPTPRHG